MKYTEASTKTIHAILTELESSSEGLSSTKAKIKLASSKNNTSEYNHIQLSHILLKQFKSPFVILLILASLISVVIGEHINAFIISLFVLINTTLAFFHEARAQKAAALLKEKITSTIIVLRSNKKITIHKEQLVTGDIVFLHQWTIAPADIRIIQVEDLMVDEAILSGESIHVSKTSVALKHEPSSVFHAKNIIFAGSTITKGNAIGVVIGTGKDTVLGEITKFTSNISPESTYGKKLRIFYHTIFKVIIISIISIFLAHVLIKGSVRFTEFTIFIIALLVGVVPEALPTIATVSLSLGALNLAKKHVIVKRLPAIEDLGDIDILCTDKTGTLTENALALETIFSEDLQKCILFGLLCPEEEKTTFDIALKKHATPEQIAKSKEFKILMVTPFDSFKMQSNIVVQHHSGTYFLIVKGAPEKILALSHNLTTEQKKIIEAQLKEEGLAGKRTLAISYKQCTNSKATNCDESALIYLGFFSFMAPLKKQSKQAIDGAKKLGLTIKILTGDSSDVAETIGKKIGLITGPEKIISSDKLESLSKIDFQKACENYSIFTRISPKTKYQIVKALQKNHNVGFLGDGVNDAPALKIAHVGISVKEAVDVAKEASDIILLKKDLMVLVDGIKEGRIIFANINKYILCTLISNFGNCYSMALVSLSLPFIPILPIQILIVNLLSDFPLIAIATDSIDFDELKKPQQYYIAQHTQFIIILAFISSIFDLLFFRLFFSKQNPDSLRTLWFVMSITTEILLIYSIRTMRFFALAKTPSFGLIITSLLSLGTTIILPHTNIGHTFLGLNYNITNYHAILFILIIFCYFATTEFVKLIYMRFKPNP
ncbi:MAG: ATPase, P-type (Transporting), HAD superfamily, subfamily IC [candidate division TM6 bacterium GW2011_GWF2_38_10]|nr:MAG: ATPase, P-type (Transporting), HAD superfamily, subfamily IC [candidate division TM6 bacterium GW2011_GWF2_38_10]